jgi:hypothetical protein
MVESSGEMEFTKLLANGAIKIHFNRQKGRIEYP